MGARIRTIKPEFFRHARLYDAEKETGLPLRIAFAGLWCVADRSGRFPWNPRALKLDVLPYDDVDFAKVMSELARRSFILRYKCDGEEFGYIPSWNKHQVINNRERKSELPEPPKEIDASNTRGQSHAVILSDSQEEGEGEGEREGEVTPLNPPSKTEGGKRAKRRLKSAHPIGDYRPGDGAKEKAITYWKSKGRTDLPAHVDREAELFVAHHKRAGTLGVDWDAGWQTWYVRAVEITRPMNGASNGNGASRLGFRDGPVRDPAAEYEARLKAEAAEKAKRPSLFEPDKPP